MYVSVIHFVYVCYIFLVLQCRSLLDNNLDVIGFTTVSLSNNKVEVKEVFQGKMQFHVVLPKR